MVNLDQTDLVKEWCLSLCWLVLLRDLILVMWGEKAHCCQLCNVKSTWFWMVGLLSYAELHLHSCQKFLLLWCNVCIDSSTCVVWLPNYETGCPFWQWNRCDCVWCHRVSWPLCCATAWWVLEKLNFNTGVIFGPDLTWLWSPSPLLPPFMAIAFCHGACLWYEL